MPVFNGERFLGEAIDSILGQSFRDFECIVVDDGSTDRTPDLLAATQARDPRVVVHRQRGNTGFRSALNAGCALARGEFIARMDADDVSLPTRLDRQIAFLRTYPRVGAVGSAVQLIDERGTRGRVKTYPSGSGLAAWSMLFFNSLAHPTVTMRRAVLESIGFFPAGCAGGTEDYAVFLDFSRKSRLANLSEVLLWYRVWGGSMTHVKWEVQERDAVRLLQEFLREVFGFELTVEMALSLRGLSRNQYPSQPRDMERIGAMIERLVPLYVSRFADNRLDVRAIRKDASVRLWLLSALAARRSPLQAMSMARRALSLSPLAFAEFLLKVTRRLARR